MSLKNNTAWPKALGHANSELPTIIDLFEDDSRLSWLAHRVGPLRADFSKQKFDRKALDLMLDVASAADLDSWRKKFFDGAPINASEGRAVLHPVLRGQGGSAEQKKAVQDMQARIAGFADKVRSEGKFKAVVHIGIGGSDLGPRLAADALAATTVPELEQRFAENVDGASVNDALAGLDPKTTLAIIVSKSFGTQETKMNGDSVRDWLQSAGCLAQEHILAVTANRDRAVDFGIDPDNIFDFWDWVGGRVSVWSAVNLSLQIAYGPDALSEFLEGAAEIDAHFRGAPLAENLPVLMGLIGIWNRNALGYDSLAVIPYARRLRKLPAFLQQLEMESNGKGRGRIGQKVGQTCPVIWGDEGTNGQHAFFQWLHQAEKGAPVDFVAVLKDHENRPEHHAALLANCFAQSEALMIGKSEEQVREELGEREDIDRLAPQKTFFGNRPSTTITLDELSPKAIGALIALYEHKVFVQGILWGVNSFDQWGVELGKVLAMQILSEMKNGEAGDHDPSTTALINIIRR